MVSGSGPEKGEMQMRVLRTILGLLLLTIGIPALLIGAAFWAAMQHRDAGGAFGGRLQAVVTSGYAVVVDDADALLRDDAPFTRGSNTRLRPRPLNGFGRLLRGTRQAVFMAYCTAWPTPIPP